MSVLRLFPALDLNWPLEPTDDERDIALACIDEFGPTAVEVTPAGVRVFFRSSENRDAADMAVQSSLPHVTTAATHLSDENWAERSQAAITSIVVDRITVSPPWLAQAAPETPGGVHITIQPSMGFGTGHHASTRLCLALLQEHVRRGMKVLDVGTGSGVLAIAARWFGADLAVAVDTDPDALENARENVELNETTGVELILGDVADSIDVENRFDVVFANLTGTLLCRAAGVLTGATRPGGVVIASGYQPHEREAVVKAFTEAGAPLEADRSESDWIGAAYRRDS